MEVGTTAATALGVRGLVKSFDGRRVLTGIDLNVGAGEVRALLGANGAGKSTLIGCLSGAISADAGTIDIGGKTQLIRTPRDSLRAGLSVIYQHFSVHDGMSVTDNIFLGSEQTRRGRLLKREQFDEAGSLLAEFGVSIDPRALVGDLTVSEKQLVEIAKALRRKPHVLILDEPTAALGEREAALLLDEVRRLADSRGVGIVYVSHRLEEVFAVSDSITVMRDGRVALEGARADVRPSDVIAAISPPGATEVAHSRKGRSDLPRTDLLRVRGLDVGRVSALDFTVRSGSCLAIYGNLDSGASDVLRALDGAEGAIDGDVEVGGRRFKPRSPVQAIKRGVAFIPGERKQALLPNLAAVDNVTVAHRALGVAPFFRNRRAERQAFEHLAHETALSPRIAALPARFYSGGNQQKILIGRWLLAVEGVKVLLIDEPTQGVDVVARAEIYREIRSALESRDMAVVFRSSDPGEVMELATDVIVLSRGAVTMRASIEDVSTKSLIAAAHAAEQIDEGPPQ